MRKYFVEKRSTAMSKAVFSVRSGTFGIKVWNEWKYDNLNCVMCDLCEERFQLLCLACHLDIMI